MGPSIVHYVAIGRNVFCRLNGLAELGGKQQAYVAETFEVTGSYPVSTQLESLTLSSTNILTLRVPTCLSAAVMVHSITKLIRKRVGQIQQLLTIHHGRLIRSYDEQSNRRIRYYIEL